LIDSERLVGVGLVWWDFFQAWSFHCSLFPFSLSFYFGLFLDISACHSDLERGGHRTFYITTYRISVSVLTLLRLLAEFEIET
jgi:hypothetical protein